MRLTASERSINAEMKLDRLRSKFEKGGQEEFNAFKDDPEYVEELPGQMSFDDFLLD